MHVQKTCTVAIHCNSSERCSTEYVVRKLLLDTMLWPLTLWSVSGGRAPLQQRARARGGSRGLGKQQGRSHCKAPFQAAVAERE